MEFKTGEHVTFPKVHQEWIVPHVVGMEMLLHQTQAGGVVVDQLCWKMKSIMALHLQVSVCKTDVPISGSWINHQRSCYLYSLWSSCTSMRIETKGQTSNQVHKPLWSVTAQKLWISCNRGDWSLVLQCYECMLMHIWIIGSWCSIRCLILGIKL